MIHLIFFNLLILLTCWGNPLLLTLAGVANLIALVEWHLRGQTNNKLLQTSIKEERLKTTARFRKGENPFRAD